MTRTPGEVVACAPPDLRAHRINLGVSLDDIAERTKISPVYLRAIEDEDYAKLPGGVFNSTYIRQYAAAVGVRPDTLLERYHEKTHSNGLSECSSSQHGRRKEIPPLRWLRSIAGLNH